MTESGISSENIVEIRQSLGENQSVFWGRFGITQSGGSRYESNRRMPKTLKILINLFLTEVISEDDIVKASKGKSSFNPKTFLKNSEVKKQEKPTV